MDQFLRCRAPSGVARSSAENQDVTYPSPYVSVIFIAGVDEKVGERLTCSVQAARFLHRYNFSQPI